MLMLIICMIAIILYNIRFNKIRKYETDNYKQQTMFSSINVYSINDKKTELENKILILSKVKIDGARDELVKLMVELYKYGDTSMFLDKNPCVHETIFSMSD